MFFYKMIAQQQVSAEHGAYDTYGIAYCEENQEVCTINDVSCNKAAVRRLVRKMNQAGVEYCHMTDVIHDEIARI